MLQKEQSRWNRAMVEQSGSAYRFSVAPKSRESGSSAAPARVLGPHRKLAAANVGPGPAGRLHPAASPGTTSTLTGPQVDTNASSSASWLVGKRERSLTRSRLGG
jgi:hypothetical protein